MYCQHLHSEPNIFDTNLLLADGWITLMLSWWFWVSNQLWVCSYGFGSQTNSGCVPTWPCGWHFLGDANCRAEERDVIQKKYPKCKRKMVWTFLTPTCVSTVLHQPIPNLKLCLNDGNMSLALAAISMVSALWLPTSPIA